MTRSQQAQCGTKMTFVQDSEGHITDTKRSISIDMSISNYEKIYPKNVSYYVLLHMFCFDLWLIHYHTKDM